jgi:hypothetical protein
MLGPAFVAAIAYVDPGSFATNVAAGSQFGFLLRGPRSATRSTSPVTEALLRTTVTGGIDPEGDHLKWPMPQLHLSGSQWPTCSPV